jgi:hypothetical protein
MMTVYICLAIALTCFILYALDCRSKEEPIDWITAGKLTVMGGVMAGGLSYALRSSETLSEVVKNVASEVSPVQEMFVGTPTF